MDNNEKNFSDDGMNNKETVDESINEKVSTESNELSEIDLENQVIKEAGELIEKIDNRKNEKKLRNENNDSNDESVNIKKTNNSKSKKKKLYKTLYVIVMILLISVFIGCATYLIVYFWQAKKIDKQVDQLKDMIVEEDDTEFEIAEEETIVDDNGKKIEYTFVDGVKVQRKFAKIFRDNNDFIGWISISGTKIDYPVMQTKEDEEFYLHRDFEKKYNGNGTLFVDADDDVSIPDDNLIIYGHNMKNGNMFHDILKYEDEDYYKGHKYIQFDTIYGDGKYEVIAAFRTEIYDKNYTGFKYYSFISAGTKEEFDDFVSGCKNLTTYNIEESAEFGDKLITLSTCAYHAEEGRFVVVAKKIE